MIIGVRISFDNKLEKTKQSEKSHSCWENSLSPILDNVGYFGVIRH
ncbi:Uncharacterised protein [Yersinia pseudotuberculosis]|nr:Uncharacterised protein [Yersinia pseudotuberculosis]